LIEHVWRAAMSSDAREVVVATDDERVLASVRAFGGEAVMTSRDHASGSDRIAECATTMGWGADQLIVNLQGDEPEMPATCLSQVAGLMAADASAAVATLGWPIDSADELADPNIVKVVVSLTGQALYFSRAAIPYPRGHRDFAEAQSAGVRWQRHLGIYCYRLSSLQAFTTWAPTPLEKAEKLEQLRFLEHGASIRVATASEFIPPGVDTPADLAALRKRTDIVK
jgi:3-deoxy-manno-octulosonate cytidylyltransferase (CMP-KDO synthetase)